jgi:ATP-dependent DNA helicase 2 subunit 1
LSGAGGGGAFFDAGGGGDGAVEAAPERRQLVDKKSLLLWSKDPATGRAVVFSAGEAAALKSFSGQEGRGLRLVGFQDRASLRPTDTTRDALLIYPSDGDIAGSTAAFAALWRVCLVREKLAVVRFVRADGAPPTFMALLPEAERLAEDGTQALPPCMFGVTLPYEDEVRAVPVEAVDTGAAGACLAAPGLLGAAGALVDALSAPPYDPLGVLPSNPRLQSFFGALEAAALGVPLGGEGGAPLEDASLPPAAAALPAPARAALEAFRAALPAPPPPPAAKRARAEGSEEGGDGGRAKRERVSELDEEGWRALDLTALERKTVDDLKAGLALFGLKLSGKKADLIERLLAHFRG